MESLLQNHLLLIKPMKCILFDLIVGSFWEISYVFTVTLWLNSFLVMEGFISCSCRPIILTSKRILETLIIEGSNNLLMWLCTRLSWSSNLHVYGWPSHTLDEPIKLHWIFFTHSHLTIEFNCYYCTYYVGIDL